MRLGVLMPHRLAATEVAPFARRVEELGFDELWIPENAGFVGGVASVGIALASTERIRIGLGVLPVTLRHPFVAAMEVGTLAGAFPGRFVAGFGSGVGSWLEALDVRPRMPLTAVREALSAVEGLLRGDVVDVDGQHFAIRNRALATSVQTRPPLMIAATGPKMLRLAGERAQGAILSVLSSPEFVAAARSSLDAGSAPDEAPRELVTFVNVFVGRTADEAVEALRLDTRFILESMGAGPLTESVGIGRAELESWAARDDRRVPDEWVQRMSVAGTVERCRERLAEYAAAGTTTLVLSPKPAERAFELLDRIVNLRGPARSSR